MITFTHWEPETTWSQDLSPELIYDVKFMFDNTFKAIRRIHISAMFPSVDDDVEYDELSGTWSSEYLSSKKIKINFNPTKFTNIDDEELELPIFSSCEIDIEDRSPKQITNISGTFINHVNIHNCDVSIYCTLCATSVYTS